METKTPTPVGLSRRQALALTAGAALTPALSRAQDQPFRIEKRRIRQSVMGWCFNPMPTRQLAQACVDIGLEGIEGIGREHYPMVRELGLKISLVGSHGFATGPVDRSNHDECYEKLSEAIDVAVDVGSPSVITFTGMQVEGMDPDEGTKNCIDLWKRVLPKAEEKGITLVLEHLNSRDDSHPMKGHPGYFGDDVDHCASMIQTIDSPHFKLLFDIYHVQVMNGDVIRRMRQYRDLIGHYHTAGNPGRRELDDDQEINFPPIIREIAESGYEGYVAQEFIPTWDDPIAALRHAAEVCDV